MMMWRLSKENKVTPDNYKIGSTKVFFRAGILAKLEELRDEALTKVIIKFQAAARGYLAQCNYKLKLDRLDAYPIIQENVRAWIKLRSWPWYRLFSRLKPLLKGMKSNAEIEALERKCKDLEESNKKEEEEKKRLADDLRKKVDQYEEAKAALEREKMMLDNRNREIEELNRNLKSESEANYENVKKAAELERLREKERKEWEEKERRLQMEAENEANQLRTNVDGLKGKLVDLEKEHEKEQGKRKAQEQANAELIDRVGSLEHKYHRAEEERSKMKEMIDSIDEKYAAEQRANFELQKQNKKIDSQLKATQVQLELALKDKHEFDVDCRRREHDIGELKRKALGDANLIAKLQASLRRCIGRIEELEEDLLEERKSKMKAERQRNELRSDCDQLTEKMAEANGQLTAATHVNKLRAEEVSNLRKDLQVRSLNQEAYITDLCNMQYMTVNNLRTLSKQSAHLESEALRILDTKRAFSNQPLPRVYVEDDSDMESSI